MSLRDCVADLVASGRITKEIGRQALSFQERAKGKISRETPPASLEAATALATAKLMKTASEDRIRNVHSNVMALRDNEEVVTTHPSGRLAGISQVLVRSLHKDEAAVRNLPVDHIVKTRPSVEGVKLATRQYLGAKFEEGINAIPPGFKQGSNSLALLKNMTYELFGHDTGDKMAKSVGKAWTDTMDWATQEAHNSGKIFDVIENWRLPQSWNQWRVKQFGMDEFKRDVLGHVHDGNLTLFDRDTGRPGDDVFITERAWKDLSQLGGDSAPFSRESRTFVFGPGKGGADAYMQIMEKYGYGRNQMLHMMNHLDHASQEIGLIKVLGPNHQANWTALKRVAMEDQKPSPEVMAKGNPQRATLHFLEAMKTLDGTYKVLAGGVHPVHDDFISSTLSAMRNMTVATSLKSAIGVVSMGDMTTQMLAAAHIGINPFKQMASVLTPGGLGVKLSKEQAAHLHLVSHAASEWANGFKDFSDRIISGFQFTGKTASAVTKSTFLDAWGKNGKRTWQMNVANLFGEHRNLTYEQLAKANPNFHRFLDSYGFGAPEWDKLRANTSDVNGAHYLDPNKLMDDVPLYNRAMTAIQESSAFAMHQADARLRSIESGLAMGALPGSKRMQWSQAFWQFKTFALSRMTTQLTRFMTDGSTNTRIKYGSAYAVMSLAGGLMALQALRVITGKDLLPMDRPKTWLLGLVKGGFGGLYADLVAEAFEGEKGLGDIMAGASPLGGLIGSIGQLFITPTKRQFRELDGEHISLHGGKTFGQQVTDIGRQYLPSTWYAELVVNRYIFDTIQKLIDPQYHHSFERLRARQKQEYKSDFWWRPGELTPRHFPQRSTRH